MDRLKVLSLGALGFLVTLGLVSCGPEKAPAPPATVPPIVPETPTGELFPTPYYPVHEQTILGRPVAEWSRDWTAACVYTQELLTEGQRAFVAQLDPAGGEGTVGPGFTQDFDGDGQSETVSYGAYTKGSGEEGNFVLITRGTALPLLLQELPGPPQFTVFTLKPDGSLWFGGGIDAGEVTMNITWEGGKPTFHHLTE